MSPKQNPQFSTIFTLTKDSELGGICCDWKDLTNSQLEDPAFFDSHW